jgi:oxygen-dependent protoporphyrinogen oxidase
MSATPPGRRVVIVGGGITGLATAHALMSGARATKRTMNITLLESSSRLGGNIITERRDGFTLDGGPDSWVSSKPQATALARGVGLGDELVSTLEAFRRVYVAWDGELHAVPEGLVLAVPTRIMPVLRSGLFSWRAKVRMGLEPLVPRHKSQGDEDESIASFVSRRLGREVCERLAAPLLGGIFAGDAGDLSIRATFPQFVEMEEKHGSLIRAMRRTPRGAAAKNGVAPPSAFTSLRGGMGTVVDALETSLAGLDLRVGQRARKLARLPSGDARGRYAIEMEDDSTRYADDVVLALPAHASARILEDIDVALSNELDAIPYVSTATVFLAFKKSDVSHALDATGFIVPKSLGRPMLAATWVTSKWDARAPAGQVLMRVFFGGTSGQGTLAKDDASLAALAQSELGALMGGLHAKPIFTRVFRFDRASAQPLVGHLGRMRRVRSGLERLPGVFVVGGGLDGIGIPDCVRQAGDVAIRILAE